MESGFRLRQTTHCLLAVWCALVAGNVLAQPAEQPAIATPRPAARATEAIKEHEPVHLRDKDGALVPVFGYTLEDFDELINLKNQLGRGQMRPRYTLQRLSASGKLSGAYAQLQAEVELLVSTTGWVRVPLRLPEAVLVDTPKYQGPTRHFMEFDGAAGGYAVWIFAGGEQTHRLSLDVLVPVERLSGKQRLKLTAPRSVQSELKLNVPLAEAEAAVAGVGTLDTTAPRSSNARDTNLVVRALDGECDLTWWPATRKNADPAPDLEVVGVLHSKVDGRSVRTEATFTLRSSGGESPFDSFKLRLPRGANLFPTEQPGVRFHGPTGSGATRVVDVSLDEPTLGPIEIRLSTERPFNVAKKDELVELAGFEVVDALRQWGYIGVEVADEWQISLLEKHPGVRQVEALPDSLRQANLVAGFEYSGQPCSLQARVFARETRIAVEPEYEVRVDPARLQLKAKLKYRVPGTKVFYVNIDLRGWQTEADRIGPATLVDQDQLAPQLLTPLTIPLQQPMKGEFELTLEAWKLLPRDGAAVEFDLPHPVAHNLVPSQVVIAPAENVNLVPNLELLANLKSQSLPRRFHMSGRVQQPLFFLGDELQGHFAAQLEVLPRTIRVASDLTIHVAQRECQVEQKLSYTVAHEPIDRLSFEVPRALADGKSLEVLLAGRALPLAIQPDQTLTSEGPVKMTAALLDESGKPGERIGALSVVARYTATHDQLAPEASLSVDVPVVMPLDGELTNNIAAILPAQGLKAIYREGAWSPASTPTNRSEPGAGLQLTSKERLNVVPLAVLVESRESLGTTVIERAWIQSQLGVSGRQDRAVYAFTTTESRFELTLPKQIVPADVLVLLDRQPVAAAVGADRKLAVDLPKESSRRPHVLEITYRFRGRDSSDWPAALEAPRPPEETWLRRLYWQVHLPPHEHLLFTPAGLVSESAWRFNGLYFGRQPLRTQSDLESWSGAASQSSEASGNTYLFSSLGPATELELWSARRTWIVFGASLSMLSLGMLLIYLPLLRRAVLLLMVAAVTSLGLLYPDPVVLLLEAGSLGVALVLLAGLLERVVAGRRSRVPTRRGASSVLDRRGMVFDQPSLVAAAPPSTRTAAMAAQAAPETAP